MTVKSRYRKVKHLAIVKTSYRIGKVKQLATVKKDRRVLSLADLPELLRSKICPLADEFRSVNHKNELSWISKNINKLTNKDY